MRNRTASRGLTVEDCIDLANRVSAIAAAARTVSQRWRASEAAIRRIAAAQRRVLYQHRERAEQARVLAIYDRFL